MYGVDADPRAVETARMLASARPDNFRTEQIESHSFPERFADVVLSSAVPHFARDEEDFGGDTAWHVGCAPATTWFLRKYENAHQAQTSLPR
jgi:hypothetical protein